MKKVLLLASVALLLAGCSTTPAETNDVSTTTGSTTQDVATIVYQSEYGFSLNLPKSWEGYETEDKEAQFNGFMAPVVYFRTSEGVDLFALSIFTTEQWAMEEKEEGPKPEKLGETGEYVIGFDHTQDSAGLEGYDLNFDAVKASFKAL
jgi:uncharacterized protein YceK